MLTREEIKQQDERFGIRGCFIVDKERYKKEMEVERRKCEKVLKEKDIMSKIGDQEIKMSFAVN